MIAFLYISTSEVTKLLHVLQKSLHFSFHKQEGYKAYNDTFCYQNYFFINFLTQHQSISGINVQELDINTFSSHLCYKQTNTIYMLLNLPVDGKKLVISKIFQLSFGYVLTSQ